MWSLVQYRQIRKEVEQDWLHKQSHAPEVLGRKESGSEPSASPSPERDLERNSRSDSSLRHALSKANADEQKYDAQKRDHAPLRRHPSEPDYQHRDKDTGKVMVGKEGHDDPIDPHNWSLLSRNGNIAVLSLLIFVQGWAGGADSMANTDISKALHVSKVAENLSTAMYLWGIGCGCLFVGPLSETVGRNPTFLTATFLYLFFVLGAALTPTFAGQIVCRFFVGLFASATLGINGSSVGDQFRPVKRAFVFPIIAWANVAAPMIAPIAGGWITSNPSLGWRWCEWITLIISAFAFVVAFASFLGQLKQVLPMPVTFFTSEPVIAVFGGYLTLLYILQYSFLSGFDYIFKDTYNLSTGMTGSCFGSIAVGSTTFMLCAPLLYRFHRRETGDVSEAPVSPEFRLWPAMLTAPLLPVSLFWLGWTNYASISIWSGLGACFVFGIVATAMYVSCYEYIIDSYGEHAAVALASITMVRYLISGGMVMAARPMYEGIGVHWTMTWLGCVAVLLAPAPVVFWNYGAKLREKSPYAS